jgi:hypothetical protein
VFAVAWEFDFKREFQDSKRYPPTAAFIISTSISICNVIVKLIIVIAMRKLSSSGAASPEFVP